MRHPLATPAALLLNESLVITRPAVRLRPGWMGLSVGLHLLAGAAVFAAPFFQFDALERPSLEKRDHEILGPMAAPPLRGNGRPAAEKVNAVKPPQVKDSVLKVPQFLQVKLETAAQPAEAAAPTAKDGEGLGNDPNGTKDGVLDGKGDKDSLGTDPEARSPIGRPDVSDIVRSYDLSDPPVLISHESPVYPETARSQGVEGSVYLELIVDEYGRVIGAQVVRSDNALFNNAALASVKRWKYTAARADGRAVRTYKTVTIRFTLR